MELKYGYITNVNEDNHVVVQLKDMDDFKTDYIPFVVHNPCFKIHPVKINALVAVLIDQSGQGGICLGYVADNQTWTKAIIDGDLIVNGNVSDSAGSMQDMRNVYHEHSHSDYGTSRPQPQMTNAGE